MTLISIDVEADGPCPVEYSMASFGAVVVEPSLNRTFYGKVKPISEKFDLGALQSFNTTREQHLTYDDPEKVMKQFAEWLQRVGGKGKVQMISDNPAFDWQYINYYMHKYTGSNPLGFSARRIGDLYCGLVKDAGANADWKRKYRITKHTHHPVDDAKGNAEAVLAFREKLGLKIHL
jgi:hypothetical protein